MKTGIKTTEFWLTAIVILAGLIPTSGLIPEGHWAVKVCGLVVSVAAALGYTWQRGSAKARAAATKDVPGTVAKLLLLAVLVGLVAGCGGGAGYIRAEAIAPAVELVTVRHDKMLRGEIDPAKLSEEDKATYLRSSELLRSVVAEALKK